MDGLDLEAEYAPELRIETDSDGFFQPLEEGFPALIFPVLAPGGHLVDMLAWKWNDPRQWWWRVRAVPMLGEEAVWSASWRQEPIELVETPNDWLMAGGSRSRKTCIVDWQVDPRDLFGSVAEVVCATPGLTKHLRHSLALHARPAFKIRSAA
jgi:hypothetical protein